MADATKLNTRKHVSMVFVLFHNNLEIKLNHVEHLLLLPHTFNYLFHSLLCNVIINCEKNVNKNV